MTEEKKTQVDLIKFLNSLAPHIWNVKTIASNKNGVPDVIACIRGQFTTFEVKGNNDKTTKLQDVQMKKIIKAGGVVYTTRPNNLGLTKQSIKLFLLSRGIKV